MRLNNCEQPAQEHKAHANFYPADKALPEEYAPHSGEGMFVAGVILFISTGVSCGCLSMLLKQLI